MKYVAFGAGLLTSAVLLAAVLPGFGRNAERDADRIARAYATNHIGIYYGLTAERIRGLERLARSMGVTT